MKNTEEQNCVVQSNANCLVVNAFAGTGKTSTLIDYAKARPKERMYYLAFNRAVKDEAMSRFPSNVRCVTTHGLAYKDFGVAYKNKLGQPKPASIAKMFKCNYATATSACDTINNYLCSSDNVLSETHVSAGLSNNMADIALYTAKQIWEKMRDTSNVYVRMPHDGYLKLYQLSQPRINADVIMVDEAQDSNTLVLDIVGKQNSRKIYVGDQNQAIYAFRKAIDALNKVEAEQYLNLTASFRFGPGIASLATLLLKDWKNEKKHILGLGKNKTNFSVNQSGPHSVLARTNSGLFDAAITALNSGNPFGYMGGYEGYRLDMILDAYNLKKGLGNITDPTVLLFPSYEELENYATTVDDKELKMLIRVIDKYGVEIPSLINQLKTKSIRNLTNNEIILTTAHKAKGMEFNSVVLLDDYTDLKVTIDDNGQEVVPDTEDINILYVAATRAITNLKLNEKTTDWLVELDMTLKVQRGEKIDNFVGFQEKQIQKFKNLILENKKLNS